MASDKRHLRSGGTPKSPASGPQEVEIGRSLEELQSINAGLGASNRALQEEAALTFSDISTMKTAARQNQAARIFADSVIDTVREPLVVLDQALCVVSANRAFYGTFALDPAGTVGRQLANLSECFLDTPALHGFLARLGAGEDLIDDCEIEIDLPDIGHRVLLLNGRKIAQQPGADQRMLVALEDVTERKRVSEALQEAKAQAEQANRAKSRFLAAASHDLRQPLQTMSLLHGVLKRTVKDDQAQDLADKLEDTLATMAGMLNALLDINQIEAGVVRAEITEFPVSELLEPLRSEFAYHAAAKDLAWRVVASGATVRSDRGLLDEILRNLLSNAIKYTTTGKILLGCRRRGDTLRIEVWDTGIGIPDEQLDAIFDEFHQIGNPAREHSAGLGLGLFIARRLGHLLDHPVMVRSRLGRGSVFSVEIPCAVAQAPQQADAEPVPKSPAMRRGAIFIIDDDPAVRDMLGLLLRLDGHITAAVGNSEEALDVAERRQIRPDIILADYNLPGGMNGLQLGDALRSAFRRELPVVILTGDISTATLLKINDARCTRLNKPVSAQALSDLMQKLLATDPESLPSPGLARTELVAHGAEKATIFIVDDDAALSSAMQSLLEAEGWHVETYGTSEQFLATYHRDRTGCLLIDARLPGMSGLSLLEHLKAEGAAMPSIVITGHGDIPTAVRAMEAGAAGFIEKPVSPDTLLAAIARAREEGRDLAEMSSRRDAAALRIAALTPRERQVMDMVVAGNANKEIAFQLAINQRTVENHRAALMKKTGTASLAELIHLEFAARRAVDRQ